MLLSSNTTNPPILPSVDVPHRTVSSRNQKQIRRLSEEDIRQNFLLEIERRVSADSVIVIDQVEYEVDYRFARQRIRLRYSPDMKEIFIVEADGTLAPIRLLNKTENALIKREKVRLCKGDE
ncbi:hypothetical protein F190043G2_34830 [Blautia caecimuris]|uniref:hypothetical protein n=1 Tax=Blautia caecimuris TaxID=1796615 RepID=UPI00214C5D29|nr:hypothetical protein [Blautia caecimuris]MCR2003869.1 hypothetical protein [Blautia caecimuris]